MSPNYDHEIYDANYFETVCGTAFSLLDRKRSLDAWELGFLKISRKKIIKL